MPSFDVISKMDVQELDNAVNQTKKELVTRYDFHGTKTELDFTPDHKGLLMKSSTKDRLDVAYEILLTKMVKRGVAIRGVSASEPEQAALGMVKRTITLQEGIPVEKAKELIKTIKDAGLKVQTSIQADQLRVTSKSRDALQEAMALLRQQQDAVKVDLQFTNFRD